MSTAPKKQTAAQQQPNNPAAAHATGGAQKTTGVSAYYVFVCTSQRQETLLNTALKYGLTLQHWAPRGGVPGYVNIFYGSIATRDLETMRRDYADPSFIPHI